MKPGPRCVLLRYVLGIPVARPGGRPTEFNCARELGGRMPVDLEAPARCRQATEPLKPSKPGWPSSVEAPALSPPVRESAAALTDQRALRHSSEHPIGRVPQSLTEGLTFPDTANEAGRVQCSRIRAYSRECALGDPGINQESASQAVASAASVQGEAAQDAEAPRARRGAARGVVLGLLISVVGFWAPLGLAIAYLLGRR